MVSREIQKIEEEAVPILTSLNASARKILDRWIIGNRRLINAGEIDPIRLDYNKLLRDHNKMVRETKNKIRTSHPTEEQVKEYKENVSLSMEAMQNLHHRLDRSEEDFLKYDVPRLHSFESLEDCVKALKAFMRVWREETEKGREKEEKCLVEWLQKLDQSDNEEKKETFKELRNVAVNLGTHISYLLASYCMLMAVLAESWEELSAKIYEVYTVIKSLKVDENSAIIDTFLATFIYIYKALDKTWSRVIAAKKKEEKEKKDVEPRALTVVSDLLHLTLREVLRLEVAYFCPDLPMLVTNEVFLGMARHLREVFQKKFNNVFVVETELGKELEQAVRDEDLQKYKFTKRVVKEGLKMLWEKLELKPNDSERPTSSDPKSTTV